MSPRKKLFPVIFLLLALALACTAGGDTPPAAPSTETPAAAAPTETTAPETTQVSEATALPTDIAPTSEPIQPTGPIFAVLATANRDPAQAARSPSLTFGSLTADGPAFPWLTWSENFGGNSRQIFASSWNGLTLEPRGASLNIHLNVTAHFPVITFAGEENTVPWLAWIEPSPGFGDVANTFASRFTAASGLWQPAGQDRGGGEPSLNSQTNRPASRLAIASGSGDPAAPPVPWVAWEELGRLSNFTQLFVTKGIKDDSGIGGFIWQLVGEDTHNDEPSLNVDPFRHARYPSIVFAETGNAVPWVSWREEGGDRPSQIFIVRGVADASSPGGFRWVTTPACEPDEAACSLNVNPLKNAGDASMAAGTVIAGEATVPWIAWAEEGPNGKFQIFVSRLDQVSRNSFLPVGGSLNVDPNQDASNPVLVFLGNSPYVAWIETDGSGGTQIHMRHLASDPQTGTWVLDSPAGGFDHDPARPNRELVAVAGTFSLYLAWVEGDPDAEASSVVLAEFKP